MQVVNALRGLLCCGHCNEAVAASSRTPGICHHLGTHHLKGKHTKESSDGSPLQPPWETSKASQFPMLPAEPRVLATSLGSDIGEAVTWRFTSGT